MKMKTSLAVLFLIMAIYFSLLTNTFYHYDLNAQKVARETANLGGDGDMNFLTFSIGVTQTGLTMLTLGITLLLLGLTVIFFLQARSEEKQTKR